MKYIELSHGLTTIVDDADFDWLNQWKWWFDGRYACREENNKKIYLHHLLINNPNKLKIDHKNINMLDNRRENLRLCNNSQSVSNRRRYNKYKYKGIYLKGNKWISKITFKSKTIYIGSFSNAELAANAYDEKAKEFFGEYARLNFPEISNILDPKVL